LRNLDQQPAAMQSATQIRAGAPLVTKVCARDLRCAPAETRPGP
jgi:hypothetical protein